MSLVSTTHFRLWKPLLETLPLDVPQSRGWKMSNGYLTPPRVFVSDGVGNDVAHYSIVCKALHLLNELKETEQRSLVDQGILDVAFRELEDDDFENILMDHSAPIQVPSSLFSSGDEESDVSVFGHEQKNDYFSKISLQSGIQCFIRFGNTITKGKKEAIKLFKLLDVFATLNNLRHDFNRIFGGKPCSEIQKQTRELIIRKVVNGACEIFRNLSAQVQLQRLTDPPQDGTLPRLVTFVTEYSEELLDDDYRPVLEQVLEIHGSWYHDTNKFRKGLVSVERQLE
ncbi:exocyst complex component EXO70A1-like protein [Tanacetum coccineum]